MNFESLFQQRLESLHREGRYRVFADLKRRRGAFPVADHMAEGGAREITVWCSNDYLGMGQHPAVLAAMHEAIDAVGADHLDLAEHAPDEPRRPRHVLQTHVVPIGAVGSIRRR